MEEERIATVVKEIYYWKRHKLLPEHTCDYLLALYTKGETVPDSDIKIVSQSSFHRMIIFIMQMLLVPFSFLVIYSTEFHMILQLFILFLFLFFHFINT